jgi:hypothetical protein
MSYEARFEYLKKIQFEYLNSKRSRKNELLNHAEMVTGMTRKHLIKRLNRADWGDGASVERRGRPIIYGLDIQEHLKRIWGLMEQPCGKKMAALIPAVLEKYRLRHPELTDSQAVLLLTVSAATIDRIAAPWKVQCGISTTQPPAGPLYKTAIPVMPKDWNVTAPGRVQIDTVSHCGDSGNGAFASTLFRPT